MKNNFPENWPMKGGKTTNFEIPDWMFKRELAEYELHLRGDKNEN